MAHCACSQMACSQTPHVVSMPSKLAHNKLVHQQVWVAALVPLGAAADSRLACSFSNLSEHAAFTVYNNPGVCGSFTTRGSAQQAPLAYDLPPCPKPRATGTGSSVGGIAGERC